MISETCRDETLGKFGVKLGHEMDIAHFTQTGSVQVNFVGTFIAFRFDSSRTGALLVLPLTQFLPREKCGCRMFVWLRQCTFLSVCNNPCLYGFISIFISLRSTHKCADYIRVSIRTYISFFVFVFYWKYVWRNEGQPQCVNACVAYAELEWYFHCLTMKRTSAGEEIKMEVWLLARKVYLRLKDVNFTLILDWNWHKVIVE